MKRKIFVIVASMVFGIFAVSSLAACAKNEVGVGIFVTSLEDGFRGPVANNMYSIFKDKGVDSKIFNANGNQTTQDDDIQNAVNNGMKGILVSMPSDGADPTKILKIAKDAGIPTVIYSSEPSDLKTLDNDNNAILVSSISKDAGAIDAQILQREFFGISDVGLTKDDITEKFVRDGVANGTIFNKIDDYAKAGDKTGDVNVIRTLLVEGDSTSSGSYDRTRTALLAVNLFYDALSQVAPDVFPSVALTTENNLILSGTGYVSPFMNGTIYSKAQSGILKFDETKSSNDSGNPAWSDSGSEAAVDTYLNSKGKVPDLLIGGSDQVTSGAVRALNKQGYNISKSANGYDPNKVIPIVSTDGSEFGDTLLQNEQILGTALQDPKLMAKYATDIMQNLLDKKSALDGTDYEFDNSINSSYTTGDGKEIIVKDKIVRVPYVEYQYNK